MHNGGTILAFLINNCIIATKFYLNCIMSSSLSAPPHHAITRQNSFSMPSVNPFIYKLNLTNLQKLQIAVMSVTVAPVRLVLSIMSFFLTWFIAFVLTCDLPAMLHHPVGNMRKVMFEVLRLMGRITFFFLGFHWIEVRGKRVTSAEAPLLVVAPHSTMFDAMVILVSGSMPSCVSRYENYKTPIAGTLVKAIQPVLVSRDNADSRHNSIREIQRRVNMKGKWPQILIFPEGTCTNRKALITFKGGAFIPGASVQPVVLEYLNKWDTFTWTMDGPGFYQLFWFTLCQFHSRFRVTYLPVHTPTQMECEDPKLFAETVRRRMARLLNISCTEHTFEDCRLMREAEKLNLPMETGLIEFTKLSKKLGINVDDAKHMLSEFSHIACSKTNIGQISIEDFAKYLQLPITPALEEMFDLYDRNHSGYIDFREYIIGLSLVSQPAVTEDTVRLAFKVFDQNGDGSISKAEFCKILSTTFGDAIDSAKIFHEVEKRSQGSVEYDEFHSFVMRHPEYAKLFVYYNSLSEEH